MAQEQHWVAAVEFTGTITEEQGIELVGREADYPLVAIDGEHERTRVSFGVTASTLRQAIDAAWRQARDLAAGIIAGEPISIRVLTDQQLAEEALKPSIPPLADSAEAREILGVTNQPQMYTLERRPDFPRPVYEGASGRRVYVKAAVQAFGTRWERKPGRPRKAAAGE
jgi:hypothetical protein